MGAGGKHISNMIEFYRRIWDQGAPGTEITVDVLPAGSQDMEIKKISIPSQDRYDWLRMKK